MKNFKRFITLALALVMVVSMAAVAVASEVEIPELPTAAATEIQANGYTLAMNFKAVQPTEEQLAYYGDWAADFVLTVNGMTSESITLNANGEADGWLGGQYDAWSASWVNVPFEDVTLVNGQKLQIMQYATANVEGYTGTTYKDIVNNVKDFDCGMYLTPEFLDANEDMTVTLELVVQENAESEPIRIGNAYVFEATKPALPTATVKEIAVEDPDLTFAMNFVADAVTEPQLAYYGDWVADFVLTLNKNVTFDGTDNYLAGQYDKHSAKWVKVPTSITATAGQEIKIMQYLGALMGSMEAVTYEYVVEGVKDFDCGVHFSDEFLAANDGLVAKLELRLYVPDSTDYYVIGDTYTFTVSSAEDEAGNSGSITDLLGKVDPAQGGTVTVTSNATTAAVTVPTAAVLDLNGNALTSTTVAAFGHVVDNSADNSGLLKVEKDSLMLRSDNKQLPVWTGEGYKFIEVFNFNKAALDGGKKYAFQPLFEEDAIELLLKGATLTGITMKVEVSWEQNNGTRTQIFTYDDALVEQYLKSYNATTNKYDKMFTLTLNVEDIDAYENLTFKAVVSAPTMGGAVVKNADPIAAANAD